MSVKIINLKCEYRTEPIAVCEKKPRFFWQIDSKNYNVKQKKFRIIVSSSPENLEKGKGDMWDSGYISSCETVGIRYGGLELKEKKDYFWSVESDCGKAGADINKSGYFRTGMFENSSWDAKWIENVLIVPEDSPAHYGFISKTVDKKDIPLGVTLDLGTVKDFDCVVFYGLRIFRTPGLADYPGWQFPRKYKIYAQKTKNSEKIVIDDKTADVCANPGAQPVFVFPGKIRARYITFETAELQEYEENKFSFGLSQLEVFCGPDKISEGCSVTADKGYVEGEGYGPDKLTDGCSVWHTKGNAKSLPGPYMRKIFTIDEKPSKAYVYVSALGLYELYINGKKVSDSYLAPEWTNYDRYVQYSCYEVSDWLKEGENTILAMLGDGWYSGRIGMANVFGPGVLRGKYGKTPKFILQLETEKGVAVKTDDSWESSADTPVRENDIYDGEFYDARYEDTMTWQKAGICSDESLKNVKLESFINEPIKDFGILKPVSITQTEKGSYVVDFGKNCSGFCEITFRGKKNQKVILRHAGGLRKDGTGYYANLRGAFAIDTYIFKDSKKVTFRPHFTYHGFRYLEIYGLGYKPSEKDIICHEISSGCREVGFEHFENPFYNWLFEACKQTIRSNLVGVVTDCNDRDERLPWLMEGLESQAYLFDGALFWERHIKELLEGYKQSGRTITMAPDGLEIPLTEGQIPRVYINMVELEYMLFANRDIDDELYDYLCEIAEKNRKLYPEYVGGNALYCDCDWLNTTKIMDETGLNKEIPQINERTFTCVTNARFYRMMAHFAKIKGKTADYKRFGKCFNDAVNIIMNDLTDENGCLKNASQAAYGMILFYKIYKPENERMFVSKIKEIIEKSDYRFITGVYTVGSLIRALSENGMHDLAYKMMTDKRCPSFEYMRDDGSQSIWERWDTHMKELPQLYEKSRWQQQSAYHTVITDNGYEDISMNSFNHIEYTTITPWITENVLGIKADPYGAKGMDHFIFKTYCSGENKSAAGRLETVRGKIEICWKIHGKTFEAKINIPANTDCMFNVPDEFENITVNGRTQEKMKFRLGSGRYYIKADKLF